jgi:hypothetical protein
LGTICEIEASAGSRGADELAGIAAMGAFVGIVMVDLGYGLLGPRDSKIPVLGR